MKFNRHIITRLYSFVSLQQLSCSDLLFKYLPLKTNDIDDIIYLHGQKLKNIPPETIIKNCELFRSFNVELNPVGNVVPCLRLNPTLLKHRILLLQELGVRRLHIDFIFRLPNSMRTPVNVVKQRLDIPMDENIMINLLYHIDDKILDPLPLELLNESLPLYRHYEKCLLYYSMHELGINDPLILAYKSRKYKSFRLMKRMLKIFREEIGIDQQYLKKHLYILGLCPDEMKNMLESFKDTKIGTMTIEEAVKKKPEILNYDIENMKNLLRSLKEYEVDDKAVDNYLQGLKLRNDVFVNKMKYLLKVPDMKVWCKNARILHFIVNEKIATERIKYLRKTDSLKWASIFLLTSSKQYFKRFLEDEFSHTNKRTYVKYILCKELGYDKPDIIDVLTRHPYWNRVPFANMDSTLCSLKTKFSTEDICNNIHLILYPWSTITKTLESIKDASKYDQNYTSNQYLAYCLYLLEKNNHFTGDGVWNSQVESTKLLINEEEILEDDISYRLNENLGMLSNTKSHTVHKYVNDSNIKS